MLKIEIEVSNINFEKIVINKLPGVLERLSSRDDKNGKLARFLLGLKDVPVNMIRAALNTLSQQEKEELIVKLFNEYKEELIPYLNALTENNFSAKIADVNIRNGEALNE